MVPIGVLKVKITMKSLYLGIADMLMAGIEFVFRSRSAK